MKPYVFLLLSMFIFISSFSQPSGPEKLVVRIEKKVVRNNKPDTVTLQFKPGSFLKIKTIGGKKLRSANYLYQDSAIVMVNLTEHGKIKTVTVPFQDIVKIRGKVYGNSERKVAGTILALTGLPVFGFTILAAATSNNSMGTAMALLPVFAIPATGIRLMGSRSFNTGDKWTLKSTPSTK